MAQGNMDSRFSIDVTLLGLPQWPSPLAVELFETRLVQDATRLDLAPQAGQSKLHGQSPNHRVSPRQYPGEMGARNTVDLLRRVLAG